MKERPILFNSEMVRAILEGRKTQTRRVVKPQPVLNLDDMDDFLKITTGEASTKLGYYSGNTPYYWHKKEGCPHPTICPFGQVGDRLWVKETFEKYCLGKVLYRADGENQKNNVGQYWHKWKPSIHMPRWASRITLEITGVRVERLNEISEADVLAEGIRRCTKDGTLWKYGLDEWPWRDWFIHPLYAFQELWLKTGGDIDSNPLVWVVEFRRVEK